MTTEPFCASSPEAQAMPEEDFWDAVFSHHQGPEPDDEDLSDQHPLFAEMAPCRECGEMGPCGFDVEGRPMVHLERDDSRDE